VHYQAPAAAGKVHALAGVRCAATTVVERAYRHAETCARAAAGSKLGAPQPIGIALMKPAFSRHGAAAAMTVLLTLSACSQQGGTAAPAAAQQQAQTQAADAARNLDTYRQLLRIHNDDMTVSLGHDILNRYPGSAAAAEVQQSLPPIEQRWKLASEKARLAALWLYQVSPMAGGTQSTASIDSSEPSGNARVRLVLRKHTAWGQNAFLYGSGHGFVCHGNCTVAATFDGKPTALKAYAPNGGEPALLFRDDRAFIAKLQKAKKITLQVTPGDGEKKTTLVYEVGGFEPARWAPLGKPGKK
jgi:hypothetical protein